MTIAIDHAGTATRERRSHTAQGVKWQSRSFRLFLAGLLALLVSAWGGIVAFVGPTFGFSADGTGSWYWSLSHALLALVPGAVGVVVGLALMGYSLSRSRTFLGLGLIGLLAVLSGAWFAIGPLAWPVLYGTKAYFVTASPLRELAYIVGYALGPGLILAVVGGIAWGSETAGAGNYRVESAEEYAAPAETGAARPVAAVPAAAPAAAAPASAPAAAPAAAPEAAPTSTTATPVEPREVPQAEAPTGHRVDEVPAEGSAEAAARPGETAPVREEGTEPEDRGFGGATMP